MAEETITLKIVAQDLASGNISKAIAGIDKMAQRGGIVGSIFQGVGQSFGQMLNPVHLMSRGFDMLTDVMGTAVTAALKEEQSVKLLTQAIEANDTAWDGNMAAVDAVLAKRMELGWSDDEQRESLRSLVAVTKDTTTALDLQREAMDLARLRGLDLATASQLIGKVYGGNIGILSRYGIQLAKGTTATEALAEIQRRAAGQAEAYAETTQGKLTRAQIQLDEAMEKLGMTLLPVIGSLADMASSLLEDVSPAIEDVAADIGALIEELARINPDIAFQQDVTARVNEYAASIGKTSQEVAAAVPHIVVMASSLNDLGLSAEQMSAALDTLISSQVDIFFSVAAAGADETTTAMGSLGRAFTSAEIEAMRFRSSVEELRARAKELGEQFKMVAEESLPELRESGRETLTELYKLLRMQGDPLTNLQKQTRELTALREAAFAREKWGLVAAIDARLAEVDALKKAQRAVAEKYEQEQRALNIIQRELGVTDDEARKLLRTTQKNYGIDIDVDTTDLARGIVLAKELAWRLTALQSKSISESQYIGGGVSGGTGPVTGLDLVDEKRKGQARERERDERRLADTLAHLRAETNANTTATSDGSAATDKATGSSKKHEEALKAEEKALEAARKQAEKLAAAFDYMADTSFVDLQASQQEALDALRASLEAQIDPLQLLRDEEAALAELRAQAAAQERWDVVAAIDQRMQEIDLQEKQIALVSRRYEMESEALDLIGRKTDLSIEKAQKLLEVWREKQKFEDASDLEIARAIVRAYEHRARGGPVLAGQSYIVGERGPELVTMRGNGYVTPNDAIGGSFVYAPMFSTASPAEAQRFAQTITPFIERERRRIA